MNIVHNSYNGYDIYDFICDFTIIGYFFFVMTYIYLIIVLFVNQYITFNYRNNKIKNKKYNFSERMNLLENENELIIEENCSIIVKIYSNNFIEKTMNYNYDKLQKIMLNVSSRLMQKYNCSSIMVFNDGFLLVFPNNSYEHLFGRKINRILTELCCSTNYYFTTELLNNNINSLTNENVIFNSKILIFNDDNKNELLNYIIYNSSSYVNKSLGFFAKKYIGKKITYNMTNEQKINILHDKNIPFSILHYKYKYGIFGKLNNGTVSYYTPLSINYNEDFYKFITNKSYINEMKYHECI